ncbi:MAG: PD-(D/E)XK nuclease family protein [Chloroflexi bacterium]|nr:PD-(D/E)XK nuclease family protein [Chloroflexota bacterium]
MLQRREQPYIWTTWLPKLLTGENSCEWSVWFKAHYKNRTRQPSDFDQADWLMRHTALLNEQKEKRANSRSFVYVEGQNDFKLCGKTATLAGRPDLVVLDDRDAIIIDVKSGREQAWHRVQVMIYQYALPFVYPQYRDVRVSGEVVYPDHTVQIPEEAVSGQFVQDLGALIRRLGSDTPPSRVPSSSECRFCDVGALDCLDRMEVEPNREGVTADF